MNVLTCDIPGLLIIEPKVFGDARGFFLETWNRRRYAEAGLSADFVQDNVSFSRRGILRGLHFQNPNPHGKLLQALQGEVFDVAVDIRRSSPTFGKWHGLVLSGENKRQFYVPAGFAHGFDDQHARCCRQGSRPDRMAAGQISGLVQPAFRGAHPLPVGDQQPAVRIAL